MGQKPVSNQSGPGSLPAHIGRYRVEADLGRRGNLIVYRAYDPQLERQVAIKILSPLVPVDEELRAHFQREVEVIAALEHACIVQVYDYGEHEAHPFVVMPYLSGGTLATRMSVGPLRLQQLVPIINRVAAALDEAHARGIIHRQLRPANILFDDQGQAYLSDFGIPALQAVSGQGGLPDIDAMKYLSPEQIRALDEGSAAELDGRSDVYALGAILFEALAGCPPYPAPTAAEMAMAHLAAPIPSLRAAKPDLPATYQVLVERALAKAPADRYPTAGELARHAKEIASGRWYLDQIAEAGTDSSPKGQKQPRTPADSVAAQSPSAPPGGYIGRYQIERQLGRGAMGVVHLAYDPNTKRQVAIKVLPRQLTAAPEFRERFQREAKLVARLEHSCIASVYDFGEYEEQPFIVMQYLPGGTLADRLGRGPLKLRAIAPIVERVAAALDEAHAQHIVHQDVKPGNILFNADDEAFLSDFGIAVIAEAKASLMRDDVGGTPKYISPEQVRALMMDQEVPKSRGFWGGLLDKLRKGQGSSDQAPPGATLDGRSDVYSLGIVLFEALTGRVPFEAATLFDTVMAHLTTPVPDIRQIKPGLPAACQDIIEKALAKDPAQRYQTAGELASDVKELAAGRWLLRRLSE
jgi:serine/threonine protein kinase